MDELGLGGEDTVMTDKGQDEAPQPTREALYDQVSVTDLQQAGGA